MNKQKTKMMHRAIVFLYEWRDEIKKEALKEEEPEFFWIFWKTKTVCHLDNTLTLQ